MGRHLSAATATQRASQAVVNSQASGGQATEVELRALDVSCRRWLDSREGAGERSASGVAHADDSWVGTGNPCGTAGAPMGRGTDDVGPWFPTPS